MEWILESTQHESLFCSLTSFLDQHGFSELEKALQLYTNTHAEYICKEKATAAKIKIDDIYFLELQTYTITIHTEPATYQKYSSLADELRYSCLHMNLSDVGKTILFLWIKFAESTFIGLKNRNFQRHFFFKMAY